MNSVIHRISYLPFVALALGFASCTASKDILYMQNDTYGQEEAIVNLNSIKVQPQDQVSIVVSCKEPELASLFNLMQAQNRLGQRSSNSSGSSNGNVSVYTVDKDGYIEFPVIGQIHIAGLDRQEISRKIADLLIKGDWISDPIVTVEFANLHFSVLGEVGSPGTYAISNDKMTILEGLSMAGDLTPHGEREVVVVREQNGKRTRYIVDLRDKDLFESPAYYLQQNDVIYVKPDKVVARQAADNPNNFKSIALWMSMASFVATMAVLIFK